MQEAVSVGCWALPTDRLFSINLKHGNFADCSFVAEQDGVLTLDFRELGRYFRLQCLVDDIVSVTTVPEAGR